MYKPIINDLCAINNCTIPCKRPNAVLPSPRSASYGLWMFVEHTPSGDSLMRGESYKVIQQRIVELSGIDAAEVSRECDRLREIKRKEDQAKKLVADKWDRCGEFGGGGWSCSILEDNLFADPIQ